ncbi:unnamed protein product [Kluyveromyces dobzhanskii CBS 2104]|uniref:WGS project CCBQ000000000 data, contig 00012 n=1 Tax=Kluyveromyces dobzhanskii CBS 2104 TaxID=1427455 RepID=A0A0A8L0S8_9SACH|nr:unnamed protein product [Kluyveromyces dobzhanskii CBS 2104]
MAPPKKTAIKMDLSSFLEDETFNESWTADEVDLNNITIPIQNVAATNTISLDDFSRSTAKSNNNRFGGGSLDPALRKEREEFPVPDFPPFKAIINNIPWDISEMGIQQWVEDGLNKEGAVLEVMAPRHPDNDRLKGMAFVTFHERSDLEKALTFSSSKLNDRTVYVSVAAPRSNYGGRSNFDDMDWSGARGSNFREGRESGPEPDWSSARGSNFRESRPPRDDGPEPDWSSARGSNYREREPREPREDVPEPDWSSARGSNFREAREPREPVAEPDWSSARGSHFREAREPREPVAEPDWSSARGSQFKETKPRAPEPDWSSARGSHFRDQKPRGSESNWSEGRGSHFKESKERGPDIDWSAARGAKFGRQPEAAAAPRKTFSRKDSAPQQKQNDTPKVVKSAYAVLSNEDEDEDNVEEEEQKQEEATNEDVEALEKDTAALNIDQDDNEEWETVGKK